MHEEKVISGIEAAVLAAGGQTLLAAELGVTQQAISIWVRQGWVPMRRASEIERAHGIPRRLLINPHIVSMLIPLAN